jgi:hypothetical protein
VSTSNEASHYPIFSIPTGVFLYSSFTAISWYMSIWFEFFLKLDAFINTYFAICTHFHLYDLPLANQFFPVALILECSDWCVPKQHSISHCSHSFVVKFGVHGVTHFASIKS